MKTVQEINQAIRLSGKDATSFVGNQRATLARHDLDVSRVTAAAALKFVSCWSTRNEIAG